MPTLSHERDPKQGDATRERFATYKGRRYQLLFNGKTKFGDRARLKYLDGSKEFWCDSRLITLADSGAVGDTPLGSKPSAPSSGGQPASTGVGRCPDSQLAGKLIDAGLHALAGGGGDLSKVAQLNAVASWLRRVCR